MLRERGISVTVVSSNLGMKHGSQLEIWARYSAREEIPLLPRDIQPRPRGWKRPTFGEFVTRLEREFGITIRRNGLHFAGVTRREELEPSDIRTLCLQVGVPAEDFGIEP